MMGDALMEDIPRAKAQPGPHHERQAHPETGKPEIKPGQAPRQTPAAQHRRSPDAACAEHGQIC